MVEKPKGYLNEYVPTYRCKCERKAIKGELYCAKCLYCSCKPPIKSRMYGTRWSCAKCNKLI